MATERWISRDFGELIAKSTKAEEQGQPLILDVVIVGSGYGGAIAAAELAGWRDAAGKPLGICILERGQEYLPGMFPARMSELPRHVRFSTPNAGEPAGQRQGLFDFRIGTDMSTVVANGLGGGSLINAGVMEIPKATIFDERWPEALRGRGALECCFAEARRYLGADVAGHDNSVDSDKPVGGKVLDKHAAFQRLKGSTDTFRKAAITVANDDRRITGGLVRLKACKRCGDCATGCNYGAKESLDTNLLVRAYHRGAEIYTGATVLRLDRGVGAQGPEDHWVLYATQTDKNLSQRQGKAVKLRARRVILAAGTLGSTEILLRSQQDSEHLLFSEQLGCGFSGNGDMIAAGFAQQQAVNAVAEEDTPPAERKIGPTITGVIETRGGEEGDRYRPDLILEELAVPGPLRRPFEEVYSTAATLHWLQKPDNSKHLHEHPERDPFAVDPTAISKTQVYAAMGDDGADGRLRLNRQPQRLLSDGALRIDWPGINRHPLFERQIRKLDELAHKAGVGGTTIANPLWQLLPGGMQVLIDNQRGPLLTVHPLGGCRLADEPALGVVNHCGQVFNPADRGDKTAVHDGLVVLDGAVIPSALGTNPALTIAAVALYAVRELRQRWSLQAAATETPDPEPLARPLWRDAEQEIIARGRAKPTAGEFTERLSGQLRLADSKGRQADYVAELTLYYEHKPLRELVQPDNRGRLRAPVLRLSDGSAELEGRHSRLRILPVEEWQTLREHNCSPAQREALMDRHALLIAPLTGSLTIMRREPSSASRRRLRGLWAWWRNRGMRDSWQFLTDRHGRRKKQQNADGLWARVREQASGAWHLATHAGEVRLFEYELQIGKPLRCAEGFHWPGQADLPLSGKKRITYMRPGNPWRQMMEMTVTRMPDLVSGRRYPNLLVLDNGYMANMGTPLFRIADQENQVQALSDLAALGGYIARMLFSIHIWSARRPEPPLKEPKRLPGRLPGMPEPEITHLEVDRIGGQPVYVRLTRYPAVNEDAIPVALIHGYSASGTTFAHHAPPENIAHSLHQAGRDVWVVDLRTSCGLPTATLPWTFERVGLKDIPAAIDHIFQATGGKKIDVLAHCMGAVMFSMAVLAAGRPAEQVITAWDKDFADEYRAQRQALPRRIRRAVLSQVGPLVVFSPRNVFSAYVTNYLRYFLPVEDYQFRPSSDPGLAEQLMDRLLATLPYPDDELLLENPGWSPWRGTEFVGTRHRMDAMYGRDFKLANLDRETLDHIDDFFGPLNPDTVSQVIHFTRLQMMSNRFGRNRFIFRQTLKRHWNFPTLSIHGEENGLSDIGTLERMRSEMHQTGRQYEIFRVKGYGHQDCWIGKNASRDVYPRILRFLDKDIDPLPDSHEADPLLVQTPWAGPVVGLPAWLDPATSDAVVPVSLSAKPSLGRPGAVVLLPVTRPDKGAPWQLVHDGQVLPPGASIPEAAMHIHTVEKSVEDWFRIDIPASLFLTPATGVMVLTIHDQTPTLTARTFDENF